MVSAQLDLEQDGNSAHINTVNGRRRLLRPYAREHFQNYLSPRAVSLIRQKECLKCAIRQQN